MIHRRYIISFVVGGLVLGACGSEPPPPPAPSGPDPDSVAAAVADSVRQAMEAEREAREREEARMREEARREAVAEARAKLNQMVFFEYDRSRITPNAEKVLRDKVEILRLNPGVRIRLEGHADERGSNEYNLALGQRRAESVREFFGSYGIDAERFETRSYGEERPLVDESNEEAWSQNRRVEFVITAGGSDITPPGSDE